MKKIYDLDLMSWKEVEIKATAELITGRKIVMMSQHMLKTAEMAIKKLKGSTLKEDDEEARKGRKEAFERSTPSI